MLKRSGRRELMLYKDFWGAVTLGLGVLLIIFRQEGGEESITRTVMEMGLAIGMVHVSSRISKELREVPAAEMLVMGILASVLIAIIATVFFRLVEPGLLLAAVKASAACFIGGLIQWRHLPRTV